VIEPLPLTFTLNGREVNLTAEPRLTLADCLRDDLRQTGTHVGCEHGVCGACTVLLNGEAVRSCLMLAVQAEGAEVTTVEALAGDMTGDAGLGPLQASFRRHHALQCGFCTPGILMTAHALLSSEPDADRERITDVISGNLCRCTGYLPIITAILEARPAYQHKTYRRDAGTTT
jgi:aerobic-type carbon monoxide dehydrogenase small subunit (CoxS/CutS family)